MSDKTDTYYWFPLNKDQNLTNALVNRAKELGYKVASEYQHSFILFADQATTFDGYSDFSKNPHWIPPWSSRCEVAERIDLFNFFYTDKYKPLLPKSTIVKLNNDYNAEVFKNKVKVGCQEIPIDAVKEVIKAAESL